MKPVTQKSRPLRSKVLREAARGEACVNCQREDGSTVMAHLPFPGEAGTRIKCSDLMAAHLCAECHYKADHGEGRRDYHWRALMIVRTLERLIERGILEIK